jgi:two-component system KDP operon response regulator KdpE
MGIKILVVDNDPALVRLVGLIFAGHGYQMLRAASGREALQHLFNQKPDLVLLDMDIPGTDGWQTCQRIRDVCDTPVITLTGRYNTEKDIVRGLSSGADDYLIKPVGNRELVARVQAVLRRSGLASLSDRVPETTYSDGLLTVNVAERRVILDGERVRLTPKEFRLFALLVQNAGRVMTHKLLLEKVWGWEYVDDLDHVRICIWHLRQKIEPVPAQPRYIMTEAGVGYYFQKLGTIEPGLEH